jgi:glycosyltransferase involved in cell wall biosynthesis
VSENTRRDLLSLVELEPARVVTIPNAVFQPMRPVMDEECSAVRARLGLPAHGPIILHVGSNSFYKNRMTILEVFARVAARHPGALLLFVGPRSTDLVARTAALGLEKSVHFAERADRANMAAIYSAASVLLFPSLYEGFGYPVLEAQLCGTPVVCSNAGSLVEVGGDAVMTASPRDTEGLALSVDCLLKDPQLRERLGRTGMVNARRFELQCWRESHDRLYRLLSDPRRTVQLDGERRTQ